MKHFVKHILRCIKPIRDIGSNNSYDIRTRLGRGFHITFLGNNNSVYIGEKCLLTNTEIIIDGSNNNLIIEDSARFMGPCKVILSGNSNVVIGKNAGIRGVEMYAKDANISIGELTMTSYGIIIRNHDSHKVIRDGVVVNTPKDIKIGKHVWIAQNASILKGVEIGDNSIVGFGSVVTKGCGSNCILAGNPAKVVKDNISWDY